MNGQNYGYFGPDTPSRRYYRKPGRRVGGTAVGIIKMGSSNIVFFPGNVSNATTFSYPVRYIFASGSDQNSVHNGDREIVDEVIAAAKTLEEEGCRVITASCGYFGHYQRQVAESVNVPVFLSSLMQIPFIFAGIGCNKKIGILCSDAPRLSDELFRSCGVSNEQRSRCVVYGTEDLPEFKNVIEDAGNMNSEAACCQIVSRARKMQEENPEIGAILLECSEMPPYASAIQDATGLPVFDFITMIDFLHETVCRKPYYGFL